MKLSLCNTFITLARDTYARLADARSVGHQLFEETFTDLNILELKRHQPHRIYCQTFTKPQEAVNGADWEWWLTDLTLSKWIGFRVQAKVLNLRTDTFDHLHYKPKRSRAYQTTQLRKAAEADGLIPLYCLYTHRPTTSTWSPLLFTSALYGCALVRVKDVERLRRKGKLNDFHSVMSVSAPWHTLVCCGGAYSSDGERVSLPDIAASFFRDRYAPASYSVRVEGEDADEGSHLRPGVRRQPPSYVSALMDNQPLEELDKPLRGVLVIIGDIVKNDEGILRTVG